MAGDATLSIFTAWHRLMQAIAGRGNGSHVTQFHYNQVRIRQLERLMRGK